MILLFVIAASPVFSAEHHQLKIESFGFESYSQNIRQNINSSENAVPAGTSLKVRCATNKIPSKIGSGVGINLKLHGPQTLNGFKKLDIEIHVPPKPNSPDQFVTVNRWKANVYSYDGSGYLIYAGFIFDNKNDLVDGEWAVKGFYKDQTVSQTFFVGDYPQPKESICQKL